MANKYKHGDIVVDPKTGETYTFDEFENEWKLFQKPEGYQYGPVEGAMQMLQNGMLMGFGDEWSAAVSAGVDKLPDFMRPDRPRASYREYRDMYENANNQYRSENPKTAMAMEALGGAAPIVAATAATGGAATPGMLQAQAARTGAMLPAARGSSQGGTFAQAMKDSTVAGGLYGGGMAYGNQSPEQRADPLASLGDVGVGAAKGAAVGAGTTAGLYPLSAAAQRLQAPAQNLWNYVKGLVPGAPPPPAGLAETVRGSAAAMGGQTPQMFEGGAGRVLNALEDGGLSPGAVRAQVEAGRAAGVPSMPLDYAGQPAARLTRGIRTVDPRAGNLIDQRLQGRAEQQQQRVGDAAESAMGVPGASPGAESARLAAEKKALAQPHYEAAYGAGTIDDARLMGVLEDKAMVFAPRHEAARQSIARSEGRVLEPLYDENGKLLRPPTIEDIDLIKRGVDRELYNNRRGISEPNLAMDPHESAMLKQSVYGPEGPVRQAEQLVPDYKQARDIYSGHTAMQEAVEQGYTAIGKSPSEIEALIQAHTTTDGERLMFRRGVMQAIRDKLSQAADRSEAANVLNSIFGWGAGSKREALRLLIPDDRAFAQFEASARAELAAVQSRRFQVGGSNSADKFVEAADVVQMGDDITSAFTGDWRGLARRGVQTLRGQGSGTRYEIADAMTSMYGDDASNFLTMLERLQAERLARQAGLHANLRGAAAASAQQTAQ